VNVCHYYYETLFNTCVDHLVIEVAVWVWG